jgi:DNA-binding CsgD family transcriptional regulator
MAETDDLLAAIEAIHVAGLDTARWPQALGAVAGLCGGIGATLEVFDKSAQRLRELHAFGVPPVHEIAYADRYLAINPRVPLGLRQHDGEIGWDHQIFDEAGMARDPFYAEFLPRLGFRYFVSGVLRQTPKEFAVVAVQRTSKQGHVTQAEIELMRSLVPHFRQARDVAARLKHAVAAGRTLESTLDWLADGVALLGRDGEVVHANEALQDIFRRKDGVALKKGVLTFHSQEARARLADALGAICRLANGEGRNTSAHDFPVARSANALPYLVSLRPLAGRGRSGDGRAVAIAFVRDTLRRDATDAGFLIELFGLTPAEAGLAHAIQAGVPLDKYARGRAVSLNTVYTHLRRIKEKTACKRMPELIRMLNVLQVPLRHR